MEQSEQSLDIGRQVFVQAAVSFLVLLRFLLVVRVAFEFVRVEEPVQVLVEQLDGQKEQRDQQTVENPGGVEAAVGDQREQFLQAVVGHDGQNEEEQPGVEVKDVQKVRLVVVVVPATAEGRPNAGGENRVDLGLHSRAVRCGQNASWLVRWKMRLGGLSESRRFVVGHHFGAEQVSSRMRFDAIERKPSG